MSRKPGQVLRDRTSDETRADLARARARGEGLAGLSSHEDGGAVLHATVWAPLAEGVEQLFEPDLPASRLAPVLAKRAREGFHPSLVAMVGPSSRPTLALVLERRAGEEGGGGARPLLLPPSPFRDARGLLFASAGARQLPGGYVKSLAAAGSPAAGDLRVAAVWAPAPPEAPIAWAVHLDPLPDAGARWEDLLEVRTLASAACPIQVLPLRSEGRHWVLSLWHDRVVEPWPRPDPFARRVFAGAPGREAPLPRVFSADGPRVPRSTDDEHPLDAWAREHMRATGARHGQLVVVRGRKLAFARAYTYAEEGYPKATLDHAFRLGSVSKALTSVALLAALRRRALPLGADTPVAAPELLDLAPGQGPPWLAEVTLRHLLSHDAGLRTFVGFAPQDLQNPLSEARILALLRSPARAAAPGQLGEALRSMRSNEAFARRPGGGDGARFDYSNEGFILLGELLARLAGEGPGGYERALERLLLAPAGVDAEELERRGCLFAAGRARALERGESPAHASSPTWAEKRFAGDSIDEGPLVLAPYADNGPFLGGAAGLSMPLVWVARVLAGLALGPRAPGERPALWTREDAELAGTRQDPRSHHGLGVHAGEEGYWTTRATPRDPPVSLRVMRLHHAGRIEGGSSLLVHQMPADPRDDALDASLGVAVAFNRLGPLHDEPHGRRLFGILRKLEGTPGWADTDCFDDLA